MVLKKHFNKQKINIVDWLNLGRELIVIFKFILFDSKNLNIFSKSKFL
ncbi:Hypothetical protein MCYN_0598 [Mycoplasmopsis cynos C142]|uniref:Uncharacterized protein n=1 Tax=Mycoplasmopsis cynos (strain C142) TaxID=1246955 RepID=L0RXS6_MYCC1|nr:Hypothetical protein MCYN_0598 [Mycoplasmopsis cynos C142]